MIIVVRVGEQLQGIIVDAVSDIVTLGPEQLQPVPDVGQTQAAAFLDGIATIDGRLVMIVALDRVTEPQPMLAEAA